MLSYKSTRNKDVGVSATTGILQGISKEGGLFVPSKIPQIDFTLDEMGAFDYQEMAYRVMRLFFEDMKEEDLKACIRSAYDKKFDTEIIAPLAVTAGGNFLELFHGPTLAFKDMALSILPYLMTTSKKYQNEEREIVILTATSGDTGKAALEGFANVPGTRIIVFFPEEGVSDIQKRQMTTQEGNNTLVVGIRGNFDDAQTGVKHIFTDQEYEKVLGEGGFVFSSANSINIGRLVPQVVYYFYGYAQMVKAGQVCSGEPMNVVVPTGNFGNILSAYYAKQMGLPIGKLICASNKNKVLVDFFNDGVYNRNREFHVTNSPSMDILISSNLERLLYHISDEGTEQVEELMDKLKRGGEYAITEGMKKNLKDFFGGYADDERTAQVIKEVYEAYGYLMDTHTAVAYAVYEDYKKVTADTTPSMIVSTASPYKFTGSVMGALDEKYTWQDDFSLLKEMEEILQSDMPISMKGIETRQVLHKVVCHKDEMKEIVSKFLK